MGTYCLTDLKLETVSSLYLKGSDMDIQFWDLIVKNSPAVIVAITGFVALFIRQNETKKEITNSHPQHLRDDMDGKHGETLGVLHTIVSRLDRMEDREHVMLERVGNIEDHANKEHQNIWQAIAGLRKRR